MIIDAHAHVSPTPAPLPKKYKDAASKYVLNTGIEVTSYGTVGDLLEGLKKYSIEKAFLHPVAVSTNMERTKKLNNFISSAITENSNLEGFASVNPKSEEANEELERSITELGLKGLMLDANQQKFRFSDDCVWTLLETVKRLKIPVMCHSGNSVEAKNDYFSPEEANDTVGCFPSVMFIFSKMGSNEKKDDAPCIYPENNIFYETSHSPANVIEKTIENVGADKIIYGSDFKYNFYPGYEKDKIAALKISEEEKNMILGENISRILKMPISKKPSGGLISGFLGKLKF